MSSDPTGRPTPTPEQIEEGSRRVDAAAAAARTASPGDRDAQAALWGATFGLQRWFFPAKGALPDVRPFVGVIEQGPALFAFTSPARCRDFAVAAGFPEEEATQMLALPTDDIARWCAGFAEQGVAVLVVDHGTTGFFAPLGNLVPMREWLAAQAGSAGGA